MSTIGIIAEYNPFHNGHLYHIKKTKELTGADTVVAVMSGNFVQRGEPAIFDKYSRAKMALTCGVDLVIELPVIFACNNAEQFAKGAVGILDGLGVIDYISFGSESGDLEHLNKAAEVYANQPERFKEILREKLDEKIPYPAAMTKACVEYLNLSNEEEVKLSSANNILAVEYLKQLKLIESKMAPITVKRKGGGYNDECIDLEYASASAIRNGIRENVEISKIIEHIPLKIVDDFMEINSDVKFKMNDIYNLFAYKVLNSSERELEEIYAAGEGITNKIKASVRYAKNFDELTEKVISKRYTRARIRRLYMQILLGLTKADYQMMTEAAKLTCLTGNVYAKVLGFSEKGAKLIKYAKKEELNKIPIITNINKEANNLSETARKILEYDIKATDIYNVAAKRELYQHSDFVSGIVRV